jgi:hypothetical protein
MNYRSVRLRARHYGPELPERDVAGAFTYNRALAACQAYCWPPGARPHPPGAVRRTLTGAYRQPMSQPGRMRLDRFVPAVTFGTSQTERAGNLEYKPAHAPR